MGRLRSVPEGFEYIPFQAVTIRDDFWTKRVDATYSNTLPSILRQLKETGRWDVFTLKWKPGDPNPPHIFWDRWFPFLRKEVTEVIRRNSLRQRVMPW